MSSCILVFNKMFKKFIVWDCFLETACYYLNFDANFGQFKRICLRHFDKMTGSDSVFVIMNASHLNCQSMVHKTYIACCKDFADFQIELLMETDLFEPASIDCNLTRKYQIQDDGGDDEDIDFVYRYRDMYLSDSGNMFDSSDDKNVELVRDHSFSSSLCFTQVRSLCRFRKCCQEVLLKYFVSMLHHFLNVFCS